MGDACSGHDWSYSYGAVKCPHERARANFVAIINHPCVLLLVDKPGVNLGPRYAKAATPSFLGLRYENHAKFRPWAVSYRECSC